MNSKDAKEELYGAKEILKDFRYGVTAVSVLVLGLLLLFLDKLPSAWHSTLVASLTLYSIGTGLLACIQALLTYSANTKAQAEDVEKSGIPENQLC